MECTIPILFIIMSGKVICKMVPVCPGSVLKLPSTSGNLEKTCKENE
jgi:hypothetical protein